MTGIRLEDPPIELARRTFGEADQFAFADWCGDRNPIHIDALAARRTLAGAPVVHGIHALLWALDAFFAKEGSANATWSVRADFRKFIFLHRPVTAVAQPTSEGRVQIELLTSDGVAMAVQLMSAVTGPWPKPFDGFDLVSHAATPSEPDAEDMASLGGWLAAEARDVLDQGFPNLVSRFGEGLVDAFGQLSRLVGMVGPGLNSVFAGLDLTIAAGSHGRRGIGFRTSRFEERYRYLRLEVAGSGIFGSIRAIVRPEPVTPPDCGRLRSLVARDEFGAMKALIIGGSRGLGAIVAKLIATGGGEVAISYASGLAEAVAVRDDILASCPDSHCRIFRLDVAGPLEGQLASSNFAPTHIYYFATPHIYQQRSTSFDSAVYDRFCRFYVEGFRELVTYFSATGARPKFLFPSSVFVEERPKGMAEYVEAKAAGELLCAELQRVHPQLDISVERLPRLLTDQTAGLATAELPDSVAILLSWLRS
jgi:hypothetical protein